MNKVPPHNQRLTGLESTNCQNFPLENLFFSFGTSSLCIIAFVLNSKISSLLQVFRHFSALAFGHVALVSSRVILALFAVAHRRRRRARDDRNRHVRLVRRSAAAAAATTASTTTVRARNNQIVTRVKSNEKKKKKERTHDRHDAMH